MVQLRVPAMVPDRNALVAEFVQRKSGRIVRPRTFTVVAPEFSISATFIARRRASFAQGGCCRQTDISLRFGVDSGMSSTKMLRPLLDLYTAIVLDTSSEKAA